MQNNILPDYIYIPIYESFLEYREEMGNPFTRIGEKLFLEHLKNLYNDGEDVNGCMDKAMSYHWKLPYPSGKIQSLTDEQLFSIIDITGKLPVEEISIERFIQQRRELQKPFRRSTFIKFYNRLRNLHKEDNDLDECIEMAILYGWTLPHPIERK